MSSGADQFDPVIVHHLVNTLGWGSLRPMQERSIGPILTGKDVVLLAPTAGGKTEAASFPLLTAMEQGRWTGLSLIYVAPLKALLNNLLPRLEQYCGWLGRRAALWHGDIAAGARQRILRDPPDILLTTPESLEAMLISLKVDHAWFFGSVRAIVVDEVHAFAGDDRGWHLLAVLERLARVADRPIQRIGLSATVGNPAELLHWLQGSGRGQRSCEVVAPESSVAAPAEIEMDYVGSVSNAAKVIAALHRGEKRLVFCDSRRLVEELGQALRDRGVTTFLSHASLSIDERRQAERAFAESRDCVIVSTSTLELGIDVGDLDRVIQINAPRSVASFLQRLGRSGRRPGTFRNCLFLALDQESLAWTAGLLRLWAQGYIEPVAAPAQPRHIVAQQILALTLQEHTIGNRLWLEAWNGLPPFDQSAEPVLRHLVDSGFLESDGGQLFIGPAAEKYFGRRHFMDMTAVFTAPPQFAVLAGRQEIGHTDPVLLTQKADGPRLLLLAGHSWKVTWIDWKRRRCQVEPADGGGKARWHTPAVSGAGFALTRATREILLGERPPVSLTPRARAQLDEVCLEAADTVQANGLVILRDGSETRWWTWAGFRANATLAATLRGLVDQRQRFDDSSIRLRSDLSPQMWKVATAGAAKRLSLPEIDERAMQGLKFSAALPTELAKATLALRMADLDGAAAAAQAPVQFVNRQDG